MCDDSKDIDRYTNMCTQYVHDLQLLFEPRDQFPITNKNVRLHTMFYFTPSKKRIDCHRIMFNLMNHVKLDVWTTFVHKCIAEYGKDWLHLMNQIFSLFDYSKDVGDDVPHLSTFLDNMLVVCDVDDTRILAHAYDVAAKLLKEFPITLFHWFGQNRTRVLQCKEKYFTVDPIAQLDMQYCATQKALHEIEALPREIANLILHFI